MDFVKMHGIGNDFVMLDARSMEADWPALAKSMCDRHFGVGADGLILVLPSGEADFRMRMFNPDGSEAEMCGNGIRCFAKYLYDQRITSPQQERISVETLAGRQVLTLRKDGDRVRSVRVEMGEPRLRPSEIPVSLPTEACGPVVNYPLEVGGVSLRVTCVSMGNPHAVAFLDEPVSDFPLERIGPLVERHPFFPKRVNFEVANVLSRERLDVRVWERGAGITLACGTGACATGVAARLQGLTAEEVDLSLPGGMLQIRWEGRGPVFMTGPAETAFTGRWRL